LHSLENFPMAIAIDGGARILAAGALVVPVPQDAAIFRSLPDGGFDVTFNSSSRLQLGLTEGEASAVRPLPNGDMLVAGACNVGDDAYALFIARRLDDGSADTTFASAGMTVVPLAAGYPEPSLIAPFRDGGWLVAGRLTAPFGGGLGVVLAAFDANGMSLAD